MTQGARWHTWLRLLIGLAFVYFGSTKFWNPGLQAAYFDAYPAPDILRPLVGVLEMAGGVLLLLGRSLRPAAIGLAVIMVGAVISHFLVGVGPKTGVTVLLLILTVVVAAVPARTAAAGPITRAKRRA